MFLTTHLRQGEINYYVEKYLIWHFKNQFAIYFVISIYWSESFISWLLRVFKTLR